MKQLLFARPTLLALFVAAAVVMAPPGADARTKEKKEKGKSGETKGDTPKILRVPQQNFEVLKNKVSNIEFFSSNYGIFGLDVQNNRAGGLWPRGSNNPYIFGGGLWFAAEKDVLVGTNVVRKRLSVIGYNPNSGASWMMPGTIEGDPANSPLDDSPSGVSKYRLYFSTDYDKFSGAPLEANDKTGPYWPVWDISANDTLKYSRYLGFYVDDTTQRHRTTYPKGPAIISGEDIFSVYKDTDPSRYEGQDEPGIPFGIQVEQTIYSWGFGSKTSPYKDMMFIRYVLINKSQDTLWNAYVAPAMDMDIGNAANDHNRIVVREKSEDSLNLAVQWSDAEGTKRYGYIGFDFLESPAVVTDIAADDFNFIRKDKRVYSQDEQIGLTTFQNWILEEDPSTPAERYEFMSAGDRDIDNGPGDKRFLMATGPFNVAPGDTARVVVGMVFAYGRATTPTGQFDDLGDLIAIDKFAQKVYDENFLAPTPPEAARLSARPVNNGIELMFDESSERSLDLVERGLDFAGYTIQRQRKGSSKFTPTDTLEGWNLGWKTIGGYVLPPLPDSASRYAAGITGNLGYLGAWYRLPMLADVDRTAGNNGVIGTYKAYRVDTLKRPGLTDSIVVSKDTLIPGTRGIYKFNFDPYDDLNDDSTLLAKYGPQFNNKAIRDVVRDAIVSIMDSVTGGHRFIDVGDDNNDGRVETNSADLAQNEKLINNVDYYYRIISYDAGSVEEGTPSKANSSVAGINEIRTAPEAPVAGFDPTPKVVSTSGLAGITNFRFTSLDDKRLGQLFGGDTIEFTFNPTNLSDRGFTGFNYYGSAITARSLKTGRELLDFVVPYSVDGFLRFSDRQDRLDTAFRSGYRYFNPRDTTICVPRAGQSDSCYKKVVTDSTYQSRRDLSVLYTSGFDASPTQPFANTVGIYKNTFAVGFDFTFRQFGDSLRIGTFGGNTTPPFRKVSGGTDVNLVGLRQLVGSVGSGTAADPYYPLPSIGQVKLEVEFLPGGTETLTFTKGTGANAVTYTFPNVPYLTMRVKNVAAYGRDVVDPTTGQRRVDSIRYDYEFPLDPAAQTKGDTTSSTANLARTVDLGEYGLYAYGWIDAQGKDSSTRARATSRSPLRATTGDKPIGTAGRYYVGLNNGTDDKGNAHTLLLTHRLVVNGADIFFDFAGFGTHTNSPFTASRGEPAFGSIPPTQPTADIQAGDKFIVDFSGGTLGLPQPGAKVLVAVPQIKPTLAEYSDDLLDQINVVPNPYLVSHIGQRANAEHLLYFTRLPEECTIEIYTESGELMQTIEHRAGQVNGRVAVNVWNLITRGNRQAQSQLLVARITTPNGSETIKKFAIVVGGFRVVE